jgi:hypothetical protein
MQPDARQERAMITLPNFSEREYSTLTNALAIAADRFTENAALMRQEAERDGLRPEHCNGLNSLARQFGRQAEQTRSLLAKIEEHVDGE